MLHQTKGAPRITVLTGPNTYRGPPARHTRAASTRYAYRFYLLVAAADSAACLPSMPQPRRKPNKQWLVPAQRQGTRTRLKWRVASGTPARPAVRTSHVPLARHQGPAVCFRCAVGSRGAQRRVLPKWMPPRVVKMRSSEALQPLSPQAHWRCSSLQASFYSNAYWEQTVSSRVSSRQPVLNAPLRGPGPLTWSSAPFEVPQHEDRLLASQTPCLTTRRWTRPHKATKDASLANRSLGRALGSAVPTASPLQQALEVVLVRKALPRPPAARSSEARKSLPVRPPPWKAERKRKCAASRAKTQAAVRTTRCYAVWTPA